MPPRIELVDGETRHDPSASTLEQRTAAVTDKDKDKPSGDVLDVAAKPVLCVYGAAYRPNRNLRLFADVLEAPPNAFPLHLTLEVFYAPERDAELIADYWEKGDVSLRVPTRLGVFELRPEKEPATCADEALRLAQNDAGSRGKQLVEASGVRTICLPCLWPKAARKNRVYEQDEKPPDKADKGQPALARPPVVRLVLEAALDSDRFDLPAHLRSEKPYRYHDLMQPWKQPDPAQVPQHKDEPAHGAKKDKKKDHKDHKADKAKTGDKAKHDKANAHHAEEAAAAAAAAAAAKPAAKPAAARDEPLDEFFTPAGPEHAVVPEPRFLCWRLSVVAANAGVSLQQDRADDSARIALRTVWEVAEPGRAERAKSLRQQFLDAKKTRELEQETTATPPATTPNPEEEQPLVVWASEERLRALGPLVEAEREAARQQLRAQLPRPDVRRDKDDPTKLALFSEKDAHTQLEELDASLAACDATALKLAERAALRLQRDLAEQAAHVAALTRWRETFHKDAVLTLATREQHRAQVHAQTNDHIHQHIIDRAHALKQQQIEQTPPANDKDKDAVPA